MEKLNRDSLKNTFKKGKMPSEQDFANLIDSMVNKLEEGFDRGSREGLKITQLSDSGRLFSFYKKIAVEPPQWFLKLSDSDNKLHLGTPNCAHVLSLYSHSDDSQGGLRVAVGINKENPQATLDVEGTIASTGRKGKNGDMAAPANGDWHDITSALTGCHAFEIVAGVGGQDGKGKYALLHAIALNTFNSKKSSITVHDAYFGTKCNRIELRWQSVPEQSQFHFKLQIRVQCAYETSCWIKYHLTQLWSDTEMSDSDKEPE